MRKRRVIVAAVGEKGVRYGNDHSMPRMFLILVETCRPESYTVTGGGCVVSYTACRRSFRSLEQFFAYAEAMREILPSLGIGVAEGWVRSRFLWFGLKRDFTIDPQAEERALGGVQGVQTYRDVFKKLQTA